MISCPGSHFFFKAGYTRGAVTGRQTQGVMYMYLKGYQNDLGANGSDEWKAESACCMFETVEEVTYSHYHTVRFPELAIS